MREEEYELKAHKTTIDKSTFSVTTNITSSAELQHQPIQTQSGPAKMYSDITKRLENVEKRCFNPRFKYPRKNKGNDRQNGQQQQHQPQQQQQQQPQQQQQQQGNKQQQGQQQQQQEQNGQNKTDNKWTENKTDRQFKQGQTSIAGQMRGDSNINIESPKDKVYEKLVGKENTSEIIVDNIKTIGLVDTGSAISTVCEAFVDKIIPKPHIFRLEEIELKVKVADGGTLPYTGCIEATVKLPFFGSHC